MVSQEFQEFIEALDENFGNIRKSGKLRKLRNFGNHQKWRCVIQWT